MSKAEINSHDLTLSIDLVSIIEALSPDELDKMAELLTWDRILRQAVDRLTGESNSYSSDDDWLTVEVLTKMEHRVLSGYQWKVLEEVRETSKSIAAHQHIYWRMYHDPKHGDFFRKWFQDNGIESNYTGEFKTHEDLASYVKAKLNELEGKLPVENEARHD